MSASPNRLLAVIALIVFGLDQLTKLIVLKLLGFTQERVVIEGFFKFVHWRNTGAAWSLFRDHNFTLSLVSLAALIVLFFSRRHFDMGTTLGRIALGLLFGGILGNLFDRVFRQHVIDFIYFYVNQRGGGEIGFPAFNIADSGICVGVGLLFVLSWQKELPDPRAESRVTPRKQA